MALALVTGGSGFIGRHLVAHLAERGQSVRCLTRRLDTPPGFPPGVERVQCDLATDASLDEALRGVTVVYHLAGATLPTRKRVYWQVNAEGTLRLAEACARQSEPPILVHVSSLAAAGPAWQDQPLREDCSCQPVSEYGRSKLAAERHLRALGDRLPVTILRPPIVFGPWDRYLVRLFRLIRSGINLVPGPMMPRHSWIYVDDLVEAMLLAAERGQRLADPGIDGPNSLDDQGLYFVALDEQPTLAEVAYLAAEAQSCRAPRTIHVPRFLCWMGARFNDLRTRILGRTYWLCSDKLREALAGSWICSADKAKRELGFVCRVNLTQGFRITIDWYHDQGWLKARGQTRGQRSDAIC